MDTEYKPRGRPKKYLTEEEKKEASKTYVKKYWDNKDKDDIKKIKLREYNRVRYQKMYKDPDFKEKERKRVNEYHTKKNDLIKELKLKLDMKETICS